MRTSRMRKFTIGKWTVKALRKTDAYKKLGKRKTLRWKSVYDAPVDLIRWDMKQATGHYPTDDELNDIILEGEY